MENTEKQNLALITQMIQVARKEYNDDSYIYLLWGWSVTVASLAQYSLMKMGKAYYGIVWAVLMPLTAIIQLVLSYNKKKKTVVTTHADRIIGYVWIAVIICMMLTVMSLDVMQISCYPVLIMFYGIGMFISGSIMNFRPMQAGAVCCWIIAPAAFRVSFEYQSLLLPLSLILSYIIPGYLLRNRFRKNV